MKFVTWNAFTLITTSFHSQRRMNFKFFSSSTNCKSWNVSTICICYRQNTRMQMNRNGNLWKFWHSVFRTQFVTFWLRNKVEISQNVLFRWCQQLRKASRFLIATWSNLYWDKIIVQCFWKMVISIFSQNRFNAANVRISWTLALCQNQIAWSK